ncbi:MAG: class I SAM-dependent methyltransferase [Aquificaceae bacterium]|nr:class I SAM-dependent methyltransferase [Aquificaceae bacterium]
MESSSLYGVQSVGITVSKNQYEFVKERIREN